MPLIDLELGPDVPDNVRELIDGVKFFVPETLSETEAQIYDRAARGCCMTCGSRLGEVMMFIGNRAGVVMVFCGGACFTDMQVMHWLVENYEDLVDKVKFRGGQDEASETGGTDNPEEE